MIQRTRKSAAGIAFFVCMITCSFALSASAATEVAKVNGKPVTDKDVTAALSGMNEGQRESALKDPNFKRHVLTSVIDQEILAQQAEKENLDKAPDYQEALNNFRKQYLSSKVLEKNLKAKMTDKAAKDFYKSNKVKYSTDQVRAQHILVSDESEARKILEEAKKADADFQAIAEKKSKDPSAKQNRGDLGYFTRDRMVPEFSEAAFQAKNGAIVGPVKSSFGYHIIKVIDRKPGKPLEFDEVEMRVKSDLQNELVHKFVSQLKDKAKVEVNEDALKKL